MVLLKKTKNDDLVEEVNARALVKKLIIVLKSKILKIKYLILLS